MMAKKLLVLFLAIVVCLSIGSLGISAGMGGEVKGTVTKVEGNHVTIKDAMGQEKTVEPKNPEALDDLKVGDRAAFKDGILTIEGGSGSSAPSPGKKY